MQLSKTINLLLIVIIGSSCFEDGNAKRRSTTRKLPSQGRLGRQTFKPTRQHWLLSQKTTPLSNYHTKNTWTTLQSANRNQWPAQEPPKSKKWNHPKPEQHDRLFSPKPAVQGEWFKPMPVDQFGKQGIFSAEHSKIAEVLDMIIYVFNSLLNSQFARSFLPQSGPNFNSYSPYGGSYDGTYPDGSDYNSYLPTSGPFHPDQPDQPSPYDDSQPITADENGYYQTPYYGSYDDFYSSGSDGNSSATSTRAGVVGNFVFFFVWILLNAFWR